MKEASRKTLKRPTFKGQAEEDGLGTEKELPEGQEVARGGRGGLVHSVTCFPSN